MQTAPNPLPALSESDKARFWAKVNKDGPLPDQSNPHYVGLGPCWVWTAARARGYGLFWISPKNIKSHRISWVLANRESVAEMNVLHRCDNRICVNPDHLFAGTTQDNNDDCVTKERNGPKVKPEKIPRGEQCPRVNLTDSQVVEMRARFAKGGVLYRELAAEFGIGVAQVWKIINRSAWRHIK